MNTILLLLCFLAARPDVHHVDVIELNRIVASDGKTVQGVYYLFWRYHPVNFVPGYHIVEWRSFAAVDSRPQRMERGYLLSWYEKAKRRVVVSRLFTETQSNYDPEIADRTVLPEQKRRGFDAHLVTSDRL